jgi:3-mercaptopyruvate sulfurtransferase SseA
MSAAERLAALRLRLRRPARSVAFALLLVAGSACGPEGRWEGPRVGDPLPPWISAERLSSVAHAGRVVVFDSRPSAAYARGHVAGAWPFPVEELVPAGGVLDDDARARLTAALSATAFDPEARLVVADGGGPAGLQRAAVGCWLLTLAGAERCTVLAGGVEAWRAAGGEVVREAPPSRAAVFRIHVPSRPDALASLEWVRERTARPEGAVVDVRSGRDGSPNGNGTIPGALAWTLPQRPAGPTGGADPRFDLAGLERSATAAGIFAERELIVVGSGLEDGALAWFVLRHGLGLRDARLFPGGIAAWRRHPGLPFAPQAASTPAAL